jgi:pimeloyl-ACP methyl ester carboxylesterase
VLSRRSGIVRVIVVVVAVALVAPSCSSGGGNAQPASTTTAASTVVTAVASTAAPTAPTASTSAASSTTVRADGARFEKFAPCPEPPFHQKWLCATLDVPIDRADPSAGTIPLAVYALVHTDQSKPAQEPLFTTPGGPGYPGFANYGLWALQKRLFVHHDIVTIDPRGTGHSGAIDCPEVQDNAIPLAMMTPADWETAKANVAACAAQLGTASGRYGAVDRAADVEDVRKLLGYDTIDYYGGSYGSVDLQAYAYRYPEHLHAAVLDSGFPVSAGGPDYAAFFGVGSPQASLDIVALACARAPVCHDADPDPVKTLVDLVHQVREHPVTVAPSGTAAKIVIDEAVLASLILDNGEPAKLVLAADAARDGDFGLLASGLGASGPPERVQDDSIGDNMAGNCADYDTPWDRSDPIDVRARKLAAAEAALPDDAFSPFSKQAWFANNPPDICLSWPAPARHEAVVPAGASARTVPALILSGDLDGGIPAFVSKRLLSEFPAATFVLIAGAGHQTLAFGTCAARLAARFFDTLTAGDTSCAKQPS